nr:hypothetical protein [uncultured Draconibacterium sp.]
MVTNKTTSEASTLEQYRVALENAGAQPKIAALMAELGITAETIAQGKTLLNETRQAYNFNQTEDDETSEASENFKTVKKQLSDFYGLHRKKAKIVFRNNAVTLEQLALTGSMPKAYVNWLETIRKFYSTASESEEIQAKLLRLKITADDLASGTALVTQVDAARTIYLRETGESQDATKAKDQAMAKMDDWMSEFYAVARIALEDHPQLLESLGKLVKS